MPVEMDVPNSDGALEPGMFATVHWNVTRPYDTLFVPESAVTTDLKGTFVVRVSDNVSERVPVTRGQQMGKLVEIVGNLNAGDSIALKATDELKTGLHVVAMQASKDQIENSSKHLSAGGE
jgi:multidrug efflux pump subunit AcrA (membrane-fusion protein)